MHRIFVIDRSSGNFFFLDPADPLIGVSAEE